MVQSGDPADRQNPSRQRQKRQGQNFIFVGAGLQEPAIVPASGEAAQKGVGVNAGGGIDVHGGFVVADSAELQLSLIEPAGDRVSLGCRIDRARCGCGVDGVRVRRPCFRSGERRWPQNLGRLRLDERGSGRTRGLHRQNRRQCDGHNRDDDKAWQVHPQNPVPE